MIIDLFQKNPNGDLRIYFKKNHEKLQVSVLINKYLVAVSFG